MTLSPRTLLLCAAIMAAACSEPAVREGFIGRESVDEAGRYSFAVEMKDSLASYTLRFYTRADCSGKDFYCTKDLGLDVLAVSPSGAEYSERVYIGKSSFSSKFGMAYDCDVPYRTGFRPCEYGIWKICLNPVPGTGPAGLRGMGLSVSKDKDGKR